MSKKIIVTLDDTVLKKVNNDHLINEDLINDALGLYLDNNYDYRAVSRPQPDHTSLQQQIDALRQEKQNLEIEKTCLLQEKHSLQSRINDLSEMYPKASILLGTKPNLENNMLAKLKHKLKRK